MTWEAPSCSSHLGDESETELPLRVDFFFFFKADKVNFQGTVGHLYYNGRNALE